MKKRIISLICLAVMLCSFAACADNGNYRTDVAVSELSAAALKTVMVDKGYMSGDDDTFDELFGAPSYVSDYSIKFSKDTRSLTQFGIFKVNNPNKSRDMKSKIDSYLSKKRSDKQTLSYYSKEELQNLNAAEVKIYGSYVVYVIAPSSQKTAFFSTIEGLLAKPA